MNSRKGMSQTLALIVAASVLMMTALTVIFMVQGGLGDVNKNKDLQTCTGTIKAKCTGAPDSKMVSTPEVCENVQTPSWIGAEQTQCGNIP